MRGSFVGLLPSKSLLPIVAEARDDLWRAGPVLIVDDGIDGENALTLIRKAQAIATMLKIKVFMMAKMDEDGLRRGGEEVSVLL